MQKEDVLATMQTLKRFLNAKKKQRNDPYHELRLQFKHVENKLEALKKLVAWREQRYYRYIYWSGEIKKIKELQREWCILMSRLRLIKALLYLDKNVL